MRQHYRVIDTPCRPRRWKVESVPWPGRNNSWTEYFVDRGDAEREVVRRNRKFLATPEGKEGEGTE